MNPEVIIFLSVNAWNNCNNKSTFENLDFIDFVPHPSSRWWNRKTKKYAYGNKTALKGVEKFTEIVRNEITRKQHSQVEQSSTCYFFHKFVENKRQIKL